MNRFHKFMYSPYFNKNEKLIKLSDQLINDIKKKNAVKSKAELWKIIGFVDKYIDLKFRKICNDLLERFENFLIVEKLEADPLLKSNLLLTTLKENNLEILIDKHISKTSTIFKRSIDVSSDYFLQKYSYEKAIQNLKSRYQKKEDVKKYLDKESFNLLNIHIDAFYIIEKLRRAIDTITWNKQFKTEIEVDIKFIPQLIKGIELNKYPAIEIYWLIYKMLTIENSEEVYFNLKEKAKKEIYGFPKSEQVEIFDALFSYCVQHVNRGNLDFYVEYLGIQDWGINEELILQKGILSPTSFRNYVIAGLRIGEYQRVEQYINKNIHLLESTRQDNALNFNLARVNFYKKNFNETVSHLNKVSFDDIWYNLNSKSLLLAAYYELDEIFVLDSTIESYSTFLRREKSIHDNYRKLHLNFVKFLRMITKITNPNTKKVQSLKEKIIAEKQCINKQWLLDKIDELPN
ncbi:MAG: hypothetical protein HKO66_11010 [Saprospiraceae bacterium]|nr:hypothetical protein [Bacteroidia bacterium]NNE13985.1 hypothetical protein [Saprospiraceae bacterium]NNL92755.1 hypothetical protein [Saprospiraceae bacterium]